MASKETKKPKFLLPRGYFEEIRFTKEQKEFYRECCSNQVQRGLLAEQAFVVGDKKVDPKKWKSIKSQHQFQLYRRRDGRVLENDGKPSMIGVGRVEGSIEDALYGAYDQTDEELRMTAELVDVDFGDGVVLSNMEQGSQTDPYRYLGIKWILTPFPMKGVMVDRDWILLESAGIKTDGNGRRYGYHTLFTVELPQVPAFPEVIRGAMWYTFIFRDAGRGMIDVHSQGYMNNYGEIMDFITVIAGAQMLNGVTRYMKSAEAKKLTILALENLERKIATGLPPTTEISVGTKASCSICSKDRSSNPFSSRRMCVCRVCDGVVCLNCRVKKNILTGRQRVMSKVSVCQKCIVHAKTLIVNPADEKYVISRQMQIGERGHASSTASSVFDTVGRRPYTFRTRLASEDTTESVEDSNVSASGFSDASADAYNSETSASGYTNCDALELQFEEKPSRASLVEGGGIVLHEESYQESLLQEAMVSSTRSAVSVSISETDDAATERQMLFLKMLELQQSAKRAHELTQASHEKMLETNAGTTTSSEKGY